MRIVNNSLAHVTTLVLLAAVTPLTGCLSRPNLARQSFAFPVPVGVTPTGRDDKPVLAIRRVTVAETFENQSLVYRTGDFSFERDPYAGFLVAPAQTLLPAIRGYLLADGVASAVIEPGSALKPDIVAEIYISDLYGDFRGKGAGSAVLGMRFFFFNSPGSRPGEVLLQKEYRQRVPLKARTAAALVAGWDQALKQIVAEAAKDLRAGA